MCVGCFNDFLVILCCLNFYKHHEVPERLDVNKLQMFLSRETPLNHRWGWVLTKKIWVCSFVTTMFSLSMVTEHHEHHVYTGMILQLSWVSPLNSHFNVSCHWHPKFIKAWKCQMSTDLRHSRVQCSIWGSWWILCTSLPVIVLSTRWPSAVAGWRSGTAEVEAVVPWRGRPWTWRPRGRV